LKTRTEFHGLISWFTQRSKLRSAAGVIPSFAHRRPLISIGYRRYSIQSPATAANRSLSLQLFLLCTRWQRLSGETGSSRPRRDSRTRSPNRVSCRRYIVRHADASWVEAPRPVCAGGWPGESQLRFAKNGGDTPSRSRFFRGRRLFPESNAKYYREYPPHTPDDRHHPPYRHPNLHLTTSIDHCPKMRRHVHSWNARLPGC
jgi:hypothetical protein